MPTVGISPSSRPRIFTRRLTRRRTRCNSRAGVTLARGIDEPGDWYEQHANAVADLVVRGESAEALLAGLRGGGGSASLGVVQRQSTPSPAAPVPAAPARKATWKDISRAARDSKTKAALDIDWIERRAARSRSVKKTHAIATRSGD
jgi:hypothetical protein